LTHSIFVTVPCIARGLFASNSAAKAWCADTDTAATMNESARPAATTTSFVRIAFNLPI
jgi:hypothetical protein